MFKGLKLVVAGLIYMTISAVAIADNTIQDTFYARCVADGEFVSDIASLSDTCRCSAQVMEEQLTPRAREQLRQSIRTGEAVTFDGSPFKSGLAIAMIQGCPGVVPAMRKEFCDGAKANSNECVELEKVIHQQ